MAGADSMFSDFSLRCRNEKLSQQWEDFFPTIIETAVYRDIPMEVHITDETERYEQEIAAHNGPYLYPKGTRVFNYIYEFSFKGYFYELCGTLTILPEMSDDTDIEEEKAAADAEAWRLIDNILDQGGASQ
jgi:hypothetical protein